MFKDTVYNRHMKIYPEVFKLRKELEFSKDDAEIYLNKYLSTKDNKKLEENWIPKRQIYVHDF